MMLRIGVMWFYTAGLLLYCLEQYPSRTTGHPVSRIVRISGSITLLFFHYYLLNRFHSHSHSHPPVRSTHQTHQIRHRCRLPLLAVPAT